MPNVATLVFAACRNEDVDACIEYSWVPTGRRHVINLANGKPSDHSTDPAPQATHVQVYKLRLGKYGVPPNTWQFPAGPPPGNKYLASATVVASGKRAEGYAVYDDGTSAVPDTVQLVPVDTTYSCGRPDEK